VAGLSLVAFGRLVQLDDAIDYPYEIADSLTPLLYLPVYAVLVVGLVLRRFRLAAAALPVIALHLLWTVPELLPGGAPEAAPAGAPRVRVLTANLMYTNTQAALLGPQIDAWHPDIVVLEELSSLTLGGVTSSGALTGYRYHVIQEDQAEAAFGYAVFSRYPLSDASAPVVGGLPLARMTVTLAGGTQFRLFAVHTRAPVSGPFTRAWREQFAALTADVRASRLPVVLAGDFNATRDHRPFERLLGAGLRDAHDATGTGWQPTWQAGSGVGGPVLKLRLDHVLASPTFAITGYRRGSYDGSDHYPVIADLALRWT
jgi:endonuclease/exonuclease/phosphatase (EEP) superfamily protein YafD